MTHTFTFFRVKYAKLTLKEKENNVGEKVTLMTTKGKICVTAAHFTSSQYRRRLFNETQSIMRTCDCAN